MGDIFLSYATANRTFVEKIRNDLEKNGKYSVWMDHCKIKGGHTWEIELDSNIRKCKVFVVTVTDASNESKWVRREFIRAEGLQKPIIPLLRDGDLPLRLLDIQYIDFQSDNEYHTGIQELLEVIKGYLPTSNNGNDNASRANDSKSAIAETHGNCSSEEEESIPEEPSFLSVVTRTVGSFYSSLWQTKKKNAKAYKVCMPSSKHSRRFMKKSNQYQSRNVIQRSTFQSVTPTNTTGTSNKRTDETREAIKRLLFCVPHGWAEGKLPSAEQVEAAKNFLCQARLQVSSTSPGNEKDGVNTFLENILNHLYVSGRPCLPKIIEKEPGIIVLKLKLANQDIGPLDFTPDGQMLKLLLEGIDNLYKSLHDGCDHKIISVGGSWTGSVFILLRSQEKMITSFTDTLDASSQGIDLGNDITIIEAYSLFLASLRQPSRGEGRKGIECDRSPENMTLEDSHPYYCLAKSLDEVLTNSQTDRTQVCFQEGDDCSEFTAYKNDDGDDFKFLIPSSDQCFEQFLKDGSQYWNTMEQVLSGETTNTPSLLDLFAGLQRASKYPERKEPRVDDNFLPSSVVKNRLEVDEVVTDLFPGIPNDEDVDVNKSDKLISVPPVHRQGVNSQEITECDWNLNPKDVEQFDKEDAPFDRPNNKITPPSRRNSNSCPNTAPSANTIKASVIDDSQSPKTETEDRPQMRSLQVKSPIFQVPPHTLVPLTQKNLTQPQFRVQSPFSVETRWQVSRSDLPQLEAHCPLGRTNVYVQSFCQDVADRIFNFLKVESITAVPDSAEEALLNAETSTCVRFTIRMFSDQGMTVVEVQRMAGCAFEFSQVAKGVCRSAKGLSAAPKRKVFPMPNCVPRQKPVERIRRIESGIKIALNMLMSQRADLQLLGLQSLQQITASTDSASFVAMVLSGEYIVKLVSLIVATTLELSELEERESEERSFIHSQRLALAVLSQCLKAVSQEKLPSILIDIKGVDLSELVSALVGFLDRSASSPHEALFAARCLQSIAPVQPALFPDGCLDRASSILIRIETLSSAAGQPI